MSSSGSSLKEHLTKKTDVFGLELWEIIGITVMVFIICVLAIVVICTTVQSRKRRTRRTLNNLPITQIPAVSKEIKEVRVEHVSSNNYAAGDGMPMMIQDKNREDDSNKLVVHLGKSKNADYNSHSGSFHHTENGSQSGEEGSSGTVTGYRSSSYPITAPSPLAGLPEISQLGWGHWFTLRDLEIATNRFSRENILGEGGYGVVYRGSLINGIPVAVKRLLNNMLVLASFVYFFKRKITFQECHQLRLISAHLSCRGQAEKEFRVEVEAIGHVRHKNLVRLLGYCIEGTQRCLNYPLFTSYKGTILSLYCFFQFAVYIGCS